MTNREPYCSSCLLWEIYKINKYDFKRQDTSPVSNYLYRISNCFNSMLVSHGDYKVLFLRLDEVINVIDRFDKTTP